MKKLRHIIACILFPVVSFPLQSADCPTHLTVDLIEHADRVWKDGYITGLTLKEIVSAPSSYQTVQVASVTPAFGWVVNDCRNDVLQTAFRLLVATDTRLLEKDSADMWIVESCRAKNPYMSRIGANRYNPLRSIIGK